MSYLTLIFRRTDEHGRTWQQLAFDSLITAKPIPLSGRTYKVVAIEEGKFLAERVPQDELTCVVLAPSTESDTVAPAEPPGGLLGDFAVATDAKR